MIPANIELDISVAALEWAAELPSYQTSIENCVELIIGGVPEAKNLAYFPHLELSICLSDDHHIQMLNKEYRGKDKATNVLSFPSLSEVEHDLYLVKGQDLPEYPVALGDIIFALETIKKEASEQGKSFSDHFCHLCIHGILHVIGYDHMDDDERKAMEAVEKALLAKLSIDDPYQD